MFVISDCRNLVALRTVPGMSRCPWLQGLLIEPGPNRVVRKVPLPVFSDRGARWAGAVCWPCRTRVRRLGPLHPGLARSSASLAGAMGAGTLVPSVWTRNGLVGRAGRWVAETVVAPLPVWQ